MLRIATIEDIDEILSMTFNFVETTNYAKFYSKDKLKDLASVFLQSDVNDRIVLVHEGKGFLAGAKSQFLFGECFSATEVAWWVNPEERKNGIGDELLEGFENWAKSVGCSFITMISIDDLVSKFYEKKGYKLYERAYFKEL